MENLFLQEGKKMVSGFKAGIRNFLLCGIMLFLMGSISAQKAELMIVKHLEELDVHYRISDENQAVIMDDRYFSYSDTSYFQVDYNQRFFLDIENSEELNQDDLLLSIYLNEVPVMIIHASMEAGDHSYSFYTGVGAPSLRIVGGSSTSVEEYPWQVFINSGDYLCGGSIIADKWVLTAAHCLFDDRDNRIPDSEISFLAGSSEPYANITGGVRYQVDYSVIHEDYDNQLLEDDLALLRTKEVIQTENAEPINLITQEDVEAGFTDPGVMATLTGWGLTSVKPEIRPSVLQKLDIPIVTQTVAEMIWGPLPGSMLMAGYANDKGDACSGDSGGPLVVEVNGEYKLAGIVSWGSSGCNTVGAYTRVSWFSDWLNKNTGVGQGEFRTVRSTGDDFRCREVSGIESTGMYQSDTLSNALSYEWKLEPELSGELTPDGIQAEVVWNNDFSGEAYVSVRALTPEGYTNWAGQRVVIGETTQIVDFSSGALVCEWDPLSFTVNALGEDLWYNWYKDGNLIKTSTDNDLSYQQVNTFNSGEYSVEVSGSCGTVVSEVVELTVLPETEILSMPEDQTVFISDALRLQPEVSGHDLSFIWRKDDVQLESNDERDLYIPEVNAGHTGLYTLEVEGTCGTQYSQRVYVYVDSDIDEFPEGVNIWPTLSDAVVNISVEDQSFFDITLYDSMGRYVGKKDNCQYQVSLDVSGLAPDMYFIRINLVDGIRTGRFVKVNR